MMKKNKKRKLEREKQLMIDWKQENIFPGRLKYEMESMWEIPQIFHFLHLAREALNIPHLSMYEMERMLLIPRASKQLANIMTSLLSSPVTKAKLRKIPPMPYEFWTNILAYKMKTWFKVYEGKHRDAVKVLETIGVEPEFWNVFPDAPLLNGKDFEELSFRQKVWLLKTVCDTVMHTRKTVQEEIAKQPWKDQFETFLGTDRYGAKYIYFPQFLKTDLRVYRHCLDNKILSTVKPVKAEAKPHPDSKPTKQAESTWKKVKQRKRKRWSNGLPPKARKKVNKCDEKNLNDCKCISDSTADSLINEDTNLSSTSTCSNNNNSNSNNNNINLDIINGKRSRSLSKCSEMSVESDRTHCKNVKSTSGYDTSSSVGTVSDEKSPQKMFKGFSSSSKDNCNIEIISNMFSDLKSDVIESKVDMPDGSASSQGNLEINSTRQYLETINELVDKCESVDNLTSVSKTDDEKLNEMINAKCLKMEDNSSNSFQISTTLKSDDEKLNDTKSNLSMAHEDHRSFVTENDTKEIIKQNGQLIEEQKLNSLDRESKTSKLSVKLSKLEDDNTESDEDTDFSLSELRSRLQKEAMEENFPMDKESEVGYNLRNAKNVNTDVWKQETENFNEMLSELSVSNFQLIADSVSSFRDLISTFSGKPNAQNPGDNKSVHASEVKLVKKMTELLSSLEEMESALHDSMKKARSKLHKEWTNFNEGAVHCQHPEKQHYKRYRSLPYPQLVPTSLLLQTRTTKKSAPTPQNPVKPTNRKTKNDRTKALKTKRKDVNSKKATTIIKGVQQLEKKKKIPLKKKNNKIEECCGPAASPHTQNSSTQTMRSRRRSWMNGPMLRQFTRLPAHRSVHPLHTLLRKSNSLTTGTTRRTQTKIGYYRALAKGKINVHLPIGD